MIITVGNQTFVHDVWIGDITEDTILGLDFMKLHCCQVDLQHLSFCISDENVDLKTSSSIEAHCFRIVSKDTVVIPPQTEVVIDGLIQSSRSVHEYCTVEPCKQNVPDIHVGKVLAKTDRRSLPVRLLNLASSPRKIKKRTHIATGESLFGAEIINEDVEAPQGNECYTFS